MLPPPPVPAQIQPQLTPTRHSLLLAGREHEAEMLVRGTLILARREPEDRVQKGWSGLANASFTA